MRKTLTILMLLILLLTACTTPAAPPAATQAPAATEVSAVTQATAATEARSANPTRLILATTTSTQDSGLLDVILPLFEKQTGATVEVIAVGSGQALKMGEDGNADVLLVHSPAAEKTFMEGQHGVRREDVMYNDFVIVGPESDPAGIKGTTDAVEAFKKIAASGAPFISRGDKSGTHSKELSIWTKAEMEPKGNWYISTGQGMGEVLTMAEEQQAYTLTDRATYLARTKDGLKLALLIEGDKALFNPYGVIAVNPAKSDKINAELAQKFIDWIISVPIQEAIGRFGVADFGQPLFVPSSKPWLEAHPTPAATGALPAAAGGPKKAALKITGKVQQVVNWIAEQLTPA